VSFVVLSVIRNGWFLNRVAIEATESVIVERVRFRLNSVQMSWVIGQHNDLIFAEGGRASIYVSKKIEAGSTITVRQVSKAVSSHRWQWLASKEK
jgi:hypothetical protein